MSGLTLGLEAYAPEAKRIISSAQALADERKHPEVEPLHLLYLLVDRSDTLQRAIERAGANPEDLLVEAELRLRKMPRRDKAVAYLSPRTLNLLSRAEGEAARQGGAPVSVANLLICCGQETSGWTKSVLNAMGLSAALLRAAVEGSARDEQGSSKTSGQGGTTKEGISDPLEEYGRDLTRMAEQGHFDPVVGRDAELRRMLQVLARRRENNPLLVGEAGIGKTAIVHALAMRMAKGDVPAMLRGKRLIALDTSTMIAGAKLRGQLEERMRNLLNAVRDAAGDVILFIPSLSALVNPRQQGGAGQMFASALARGELRAIAIATPDGVRKAFDSDMGLSRRFVEIAVDAPNKEESVAILRGLVGRYETDHGVKISDPALVTAVDLAKRYVPSVQLPKSAIDLVDEAAARVRVEIESVPAELDRMERRIERLSVELVSLEDEEDAGSQKSKEAIEAELSTLQPRAEAMRASWKASLTQISDVRRLRQELLAAQREYDQARAAEDHGKAGELRFGTLPRLEKALSEAESKVSEESTELPPAVKELVTEQDVADVVASWTGVPVSRMMEGEAEKLLHMEARLEERVIGQDVALTAVSKAVRRGRVGLRDPKRPIGSFLFLGPTGVGKTELAKALAEFLFDDEASLTRLDMSEFMEKHMVARLLGSPPGYVDSDDGGFLTEAVRSRPYSVVLFDEMEKAHPDVFNILLQVLDDGRLTDSKGRPAYFADTVVIMTSNVGSHLILDHEGDNASLKEKVEEELHSHFRPEFLNRIDDVVIFDPLDKEDLAGIVDIQLRNLRKMLAHRHLELELSPAAKDHIVELGYEPAFGARPVKRVILKELQDPMAESILKGGYGAGQAIRVDLVDGTLQFEASPAGPDSQKSSETETTTASRNESEESSSSAANEIAKEVNAEP